MATGGYFSFFRLRFFRCVIRVSWNPFAAKINRVARRTTTQLRTTPVRLRNVAGRRAAFRGFRALRLGRGGSDAARRQIRRKASRGADGETQIGNRRSRRAAHLRLGRQGEGRRPDSDRARNGIERSRTGAKKTCARRPDRDACRTRARARAASAAGGCTTPHDRFVACDFPLRARLGHWCPTRRRGESAECRTRYSTRPECYAGRLTACSGFA